MTSAKIASWIILQALDISKENIAGYSIQSAHREALELTDAVEVYREQQGRDADYENMCRTLDDIREIVQEMKALEQAKFEANGIAKAFTEGFSLRTVGSVAQLFKQLPDVPDGHIVIDIGGGVDVQTNSQLKDWGVTAVVNTNGLNNFTTVFEKLTLDEALELYKELPLPTGPGVVQNIFNTWEDALAHNEDNPRPSI